MLLANGQMHNEHIPVVIDAVKAVRPDAGTVGEQTRLVGAGALLDSVGLVSLLINLEQRLDNAVDLASSLMASASVVEEEHPFRTVGTLADHIHQLLAARS
jgi:hypothetical protein